MTARAARAVCLALAASLPALSAPVRLSGWIGAQHVAYRAMPVRDARSYPVSPRDAVCVAITEVYPDDLKPVCYHYLVSGPGIATFERRYAATGFGPVTYFLAAEHKPAGPITIANLDRATPPRFLSIRGVTAGEIVAARKADRFTLPGTVINPRAGFSDDAQAAAIAQRLPTQPDRGIDHAFSREIYYAALSGAGVRRQIEDARRWAKQYRMRPLLGLVSWWNGTPLRVPDGRSGTFGDLRYQQVCYTPNHENPDDEGLRALLGARYNRHYRRTVPNIWSSTPWLTMNSPALNAYRARHLQEAIGILKEVSRGDLSWVAGIYLENEPRYWDTQSTQGTPQYVGEQWADFNPCVIAAAARDGMDLDPSDGLSKQELDWLQRNVGRYNQQTVDVVDRALANAGMRSKIPVYTHSLQLGILFPGIKINRTAADWACVAGGRTGIEGIWTELSDFDRVREWGPWCNLNREETDGQPIDTHLWDLRTAYAMGAVLYNSYNWHLLKDDAYFRYARRFLNALPTVTLPPAHAERSAPDVLTITPPQELQAFDSVSAPIRRTSSGAAARSAALSVDGSPDRTWFSQRVALPPTGGTLTFDFPAPAEVRWRSKAALRLHAYNASGVEIAGVAAFAGSAPADLRLSLDLVRSRALSRVLIGWRRGGTGRPDAERTRVDR